MNSASIQNSERVARTGNGSASPSLRRGRTPFAYSLAWFVLVIALAASGCGLVHRPGTRGVGSAQTFDEEASRIVTRLPIGWPSIRTCCTAGRGCCRELFGGARGMARLCGKRLGGQTLSGRQRRRLHCQRATGAAGGFSSKSPGGQDPGLRGEQRRYERRFVHREIRRTGGTATGGLLGWTSGLDSSGVPWRNRRVTPTRPESAARSLFRNRVRSRKNGFLCCCRCIGTTCRSLRCCERRAEHRGLGLCAVHHAAVDARDSGDKTQLLRCEVFDRDPAARAS